VLLAAQPELVTPVLQVVQRVIARHLLQAAGLEAGEGHGGAVTLIQRFGSAANLNIHLHGLLLEGVSSHTTFRSACSIAVVEGAGRQSAMWR